MTSKDKGITCAKHGIYGSEWPHYEKCPYCSETDILNERIKTLEETEQRLLQKLSEAAHEHIR